MSLSDELRSFADTSRERNDIPYHVYQDLISFYDDIKALESKCNERNVITTNEHARVIHFYVNMIGEVNKENAKLRELVKTLWNCGDYYFCACTSDNGKTQFCPMFRNGEMGCVELTRELGIEVEL